MPEYLNIQQAARRMGLTTNAVRALCQSEDLPGAIQIRRRGPWRIPVEAIEAWVEANNERRQDRRRRITRVTRFISLAGITTAIALIFAFVSGLADWDKAVLRLQQWGLLSSYSPAASDETLIIVFDFNRTENVVDTDIAGEISRAIQIEASKDNLSNIRVVTDPRQLKSNDKERARKIGLSNEASIVVWGEDTGVRVTVHFLNIKNPDLYLSDIKIDENQNTQIAHPNEYATLVTYSLPNQLTTLSLFALGQTLLIDENKYSDALSMFIACQNSLDGITDFEGEEYIYQYLAPLYTYKKNYPAALSAANKALEFDPNDYVAHINKGVIFGIETNYPNAYNEFNLAISIDPNEKVAYYNRGLTYAYEKKYPQAIADFSYIIDNIDSNYDWAYFNRGLALAFSDDADGAIRDYSKAIEINSRFWVAYLGRGGIYLQIGNNQGAIDDTTAILNEYPDIQKALAIRSLAYTRSGRYEEAIIDTTKILQILPEDATYYCNRGLLYKTTGKTSKAIDDYNACLQYANTAELKAVAEDALLDLQKP